MTPPASILTAQELLSEEFALVSIEGESFSFKLFELMAWSKGFQGLVTTGSGEKKVQLDEKAITINQFKELGETQTFATVTSSDSLPFDQVIALIRFLDKFECGPVLYYFVEVLKSKLGQNWPPLLLFFAGAILARLDLCKAALDWRATNWNALPREMWPKGVKSKYFYPLHPRGMPYHIQIALPPDHLLALSLSEVVCNISSHEYNGRSNLYGVRFERELAAIKDDIKYAKAQGTIGQ